MGDPQRRHLRPTWCLLEAWLGSHLGHRSDPPRLTAPKQQRSGHFQGLIRRYRVMQQRSTVLLHHQE